ncbi:hypothetical protein CSW98_06720 [Vibrio sp. HA2012]|uniref:ABC transporter permease n=1 Tax=Vibrio sp. HA2012 TaxID=1971595 RepID=UPI000C2C3EEA|nr:ABC transporter permease subunit [Vibrio sp. HA2012]PJC86681.1 hypothetical protein CSW98_06720 [Vibrio sp. HA2012]
MNFPMKVLIFLAFLSFFLYFSGWPDISMSTDVLSAPSYLHFLGTDAMGQDVLFKLLSALPYTLLISLMCGILPVIIGLILSVTSVWSGGWIDRIISKFIDIFLLLPSLLILIVFSGILETSFISTVLLISFLNWADDYKVLKASLYKIKQSDAILTCMSFGASRFYLLINYIFPPLQPVILMLFLQNARHSVIIVAGLSFLGLTDPRLLTWGTLLMEAQQQIHHQVFWWLICGPVVGISMLVILLTYSGRTKN